MRGNWVSFVLAFVCIGFVVGATISFTIPHQEEGLVATGSDFGIVGGLAAPFHANFPPRSYNRTIDISLHCTNGSLDITILSATEWIAWDQGENYSACYEMRNVTSIVTTIEIDPQYSWIDIILQTNYGDVWMNVNIFNLWMGYDDSTGMNSLIVAIPFGLGSLYFATKEPKKDDNSNEAILS